MDIDTLNKYVQSYFLVLVGNLGRLILTNYALYFEASGVITYEKAIKIDLSKQDVDHNVSPAPTGPWGAPLFDKGMVYESSQLYASSA